MSPLFGIFRDLVLIGQARQDSFKNVKCFMLLKTIIHVQDQC